MAAQDAVALENHVKLFVETKVAENVAMEISSGCVYIRPCVKRGSTTLGAFWVRVIQSYFPKDQFTYRKHYSTAVGSEALSVSLLCSKFQNKSRYALIKCFILFLSTFCR